MSTFTKFHSLPKAFVYFHNIRYNFTSSLVFGQELNGCIVGSMLTVMKNTVVLSTDLLDVRRSIPSSSKQR